MSRLRMTFLSSSIVIMLFAVLTFFANQANAMMLKLDLQELAGGADSIVVGTVVGRTSQWNAEHTHIETQVTISVEERVKGAGNNTVTVTLLGGEVDGITEWVSDMPSFNQGERVMVFLKEQAGKNEVYGLNQCRCNVQQD